MSKKTSLIPLERIERSILFLRGQKIMLDSDLADLYGVSTKRLNEQVKRNVDRLPSDFMFKLTPQEKTNVVANCDHLLTLKYSSTLPYAFTEHGALMLANTLRSKKAITTSILIVRTFVKMRQLLASHAVLARRLDSLEKKYDKRFRVVFDAIRQLREQSDTPRHQIGFRYQTKQRLKSGSVPGGGNSKY